jgi:SAM-dependent methyltransferase
MAKIKYVQEASDDQPESVECIELTPWRITGTEGQSFCIGSGANFSASGNAWLEIKYSVQDVPLFYTRNFLHDSSGFEGFPAIADYFERFLSGEVDRFGFGDMLPETGLLLIREKYTQTELDGEESVHHYYNMEIAVDMGAVFGAEAPGTRMIKIELRGIELEEAEQFMRAFMKELEEVTRGIHPDPKVQPDDSGWSFERRLNTKAYDLISAGYKEDYFDNPRFTTLFDTWLDGISLHGQILDAGCGHGEPVIRRLLEKGFCVTGTDSSPVMLQQARQKFPNVLFHNKTIREIDDIKAFDGICSLSSLLYLDPIDLSYSLHRLHQALKPGGCLFLHAYDLHPSWRGVPFGVEINHWMWSWTYSMDEVVKFLEEFHLFKVLQMENVITEEERIQRIESWRKYTLKEHYDFVEKYLAGLPEPEPPDVSGEPANLAYPYVIIARRV